MPTWKILGQAAATTTGTTGRLVVYTNGTTNGAIAWALVTNRTTGSILTDLWAATSTAGTDKANIVHFPVPKQDTLEVPRFTLSTADSVIFQQATTGISVSVFGAEGVATG